MRYDSKQARFESDLGSRGNAEYVNLILPPRWDTKWEEDGLGGIQGRGYCWGYG